MRLCCFGLLACVVTNADAYACSVAFGGVIHQFPADGTRIAPNDGFAVHFVGDLYREELTPVLHLQGETEPFDVDLTLQRYDVGIYSRVFFVRPTEPLPPGRYTFHVRYEAWNWEGDIVEVAGPTTRFEVVPAKATPDVRLEAEWDRVAYDDVILDSCGFYRQVLFVRLEARTIGTEPVWFEIDVEGGGTTETWLAPGPTAGGMLEQSLAVNLEAECIMVTPVSLGGPIGEPYRSCQPERCLSLAKTERGLPDPIELRAAEPCTPQMDGALALDREHSGCRCQGNNAATSSSLLLLAMLLTAAICVFRPLVNR